MTIGEQMADRAQQNVSPLDVARNDGNFLGTVLSPTDRKFGDIVHCFRHSSISIQVSREGVAQ